jgi:hypothetical protein
MKGETRILEDRIEIAALERRIGETHERIRRGKNEQLKGGGNPRLHPERVCLERRRQIAAEGRNQRPEQSENEHPQHHRAFVVPPDAGEPVDQRHRRVGILVDVEHREVRGDVAHREGAKGDGDEGELRQRDGARHACEHNVAAAGAEDRYRALNEREPEREHQRVMSEFRDHWYRLPPRRALERR